MRTTLTLDDDVAALLKRLIRLRRSSLKTIVNEGLRRGLNDLNSQMRPTRPYATPTVKLGRCLVNSLDDVAETLATVEGEAFQ
jgi:hypothetical protein